MKPRYLLFFVLLASLHLAIGQRFHLPKQKKFEKVKFELINNLMVVPVELNGVKLSFILDTGVSNPILFNLNDQDSIQINQVTEITLRGLGEGEPMKALKSMNNSFAIGDAKSFGQSLYVVLDKDLNFSPLLGITVHGIIGYDFFKDFVVEVSYTSKTLKLYRPEEYAYRPSRKRQTLPLKILDKKAYVEGSIIKEDNAEVPVKLLVDTGSSDALWLFRDVEKGLEIPDASYEDFLGKGLNGDIFGKRTKLRGLKIGGFQLDAAKVAFPYRKSFAGIEKLGGRNGSVGGEVLKRFNIVFDYPNGRITLAKNARFNDPFRYNLAGIELQHNGVRYISESIADVNGFVTGDKRSFGNVQLVMENRTRLSLVPEIVVSGIRAGSPAEEAGLQEGDIVLAVNGKRVHQYKLQEILEMLNQREGKRIRVLIERYNKDVLLFTFVLKDLFE